MVVKMRYAPTSGSLSGISFEKQTERAFNELGVEIDNANTTASEALGVATQAENNSNQAILSVQAATEAANDASLKADAANSTAQQAVATANAAQTAANNATDQSMIALTNSQTTLSEVADANTAANNALNVATQARGMAQTASVQAQQAVSMFVNGMAYTVTPDATDLNTMYSAQRLYLTGTVNNAPIAVPFYLDVVSTNDVTGATQRAWSPDSPQEIYSRSAAIVNPTSQNPSVTWGAWQSSSLNAQPLGQIPPLVPDNASVMWAIPTNTQPPNSYGACAFARWTAYDPILYAINGIGINAPMMAGTLYAKRLYLPVPLKQIAAVAFATAIASSDNLQFALYTADIPGIQHLTGLVAQTVMGHFSVPHYSIYFTQPGVVSVLEFPTPLDLNSGAYWLTAWSTNATTGTLRALPLSTHSPGGDTFTMGYQAWDGYGTSTTATPPMAPPQTNGNEIAFWAALVGTLGAGPTAG